MKKNNFERTLKRAEIYQTLIESYNNGISLKSINDMIKLDYEKYMRKIKYSFTGLKESYNYNNPTVINDEEDYIDVQRAQEYFYSKILNIKNQDKKNFFDLVLEQKQSFIDEFKDVDTNNAISMVEYDIKLFEENKELNDIIETESEESLDAFSKQEDKTTAIKTEKEKEIKKLALELIKKENN